MKIQILSDLHLEMGVNPILKNFKPVGDVLVLAGDICGAKSRRILDETFNKIKIPVLYIMGNHEYYGGHIDNTLELSREWFNPDARTLLPWSNIRLLEDNYYDYNGVRFIGCTYWCDVATLEEYEVKRCIADFKVIEGCTIDLLRQRHKRSKDYIKLYSEQARALGLRVVVITHFPPSWQAREERFKSSGLGSYFYNDDEDFVKLVEPDLWIYGHTHGNLRFKVGNVPVECNQMGYTKSFSNGIQAEPCYQHFDLNYTVKV